MKPESKFRSSKVHPFLKTLAHCWFTSVQQLAISGIPDYLLVIRGRFVGLEIKAEGGKATPLQAHNLGLIEKAGGVALVAHPSNWEECKLLLQQLDRGEVKWSP